MGPTASQATADSTQSRQPRVIALEAGERACRSVEARVIAPEHDPARQAAADSTQSRQPRVIAPEAGQRACSTSLAATTTRLPSSSPSSSSRQPELVKQVTLSSAVVGSASTLSGSAAPAKLSKAKDSAKSLCQGHRLYRSGALYWCSTCGAYAERRLKGLKSACQGAAGKGPRAGQLARPL